MQKFEVEVELSIRMLVEDLMEIIFVLLCNIHLYICLHSMYTVKENVTLTAEKIHSDKDAVMFPYSDSRPVPAFRGVAYTGSHMTSHMTRNPFILFMRHDIRRRFDIERYKTGN